MSGLEFELCSFCAVSSRSHNDQSANSVCVSQHHQLVTASVLQVQVESAKKKVKGYEFLS